ncbi:Arginyl-tRNA synthetase (EC [uncultured Gammaproteobacteria bacterium]|nr:Arginyl-tRNA synthetase (EC [uncultured Gammaproteobacteria bacterium]
MNKEQLQVLLMESLVSLKTQGVLEKVPENIRLDHSKDKTQGDFASNIAMMLSKQAGCAPRELAQKIKANFPDSAEVERLRLRVQALLISLCLRGLMRRLLIVLLSRERAMVRPMWARGQRGVIGVCICQSDRTVACRAWTRCSLWATVANLLRVVCFEVDNEYYVNDAGRQMDILATSVYLRYVETDKFPDNGYKGIIFLILPKKFRELKKLDIFSGVCKDEKTRWR